MEMQGKGNGLKYMKMFGQIFTASDQPVDKFQ